MTYLPALQLVLFGLVLLYEIVEDLPQAFGISLDRRDDILDRPFNENTID